MSNTETKENILQRAKDAGIKVTDEGKIVLPGNLKSKPTKEKKPRATKTSKVAKTPKSTEPKPFKGFSSDIFSTGANTANSVAEGLSVLANNSITPDANWKLSTYKKELRFAFENKKVEDAVSTEDLEKLLNLGWEVSKNILVFKLAQ